MCAHTRKTSELFVGGMYCACELQFHTTFKEGPFVLWQAELIELERKASFFPPLPLPGLPQGQAHTLMLKGKALNVSPDYSAQAEELLSKAVKLDPELVEAWNQLGEVYWKKGDVSAAHTCFSGALSHVSFPQSLPLGRRGVGFWLAWLSGVTSKFF